ncbi:MAG: hypothetical protein AAF193_00540 [Bacteroidota bacterium]
MDIEFVNPSIMNRYIKSFSSLTDADKMMIRDQYPNGFSGKDFSMVKTANGTSLEVLEVQTSEAIYLVKVNKMLLDSFEEMTAPD